MEKTKKRGRKPLPKDQKKIAPLNMRTSQEIRDLLETASTDSGWSLTQEVEHRLEKSFKQDDLDAGMDHLVFGLGRNALPPQRLLAISVSRLLDGFDGDWLMDAKKTFQICHAFTHINTTYGQVLRDQSGECPNEEFNRNDALFEITEIINEVIETNEKVIAKELAKSIKRRPKGQ